MESNLRSLVLNHSSVVVGSQILKFLRYNNSFTKFEANIVRVRTRVRMWCPSVLSSGVIQDMVSLQGKLRVRLGTKFNHWSSDVMITQIAKKVLSSLFVVVSLQDWKFLCKDTTC